MSEIALEPSSAGTGSRGGHPFWKVVLPAYVSSRLFIAFFVYLGHLSHPFREKIEGGYPGVSNWLLNPWTTFDTTHYFSIARDGYAPITAPFFPLYPWFLGVFGHGENTMALVGVLISNAAFLGALWVLWGLTRRSFEESLARRSIWMLAFFPAAAFSMAVYTESLFLVLALGTFYLARRSNWLGAGVMAFLTALTRNSGPILAIALALEWWRQRRSGEKPAQLGLLAAAAPIVGFALVQTYIKFSLRGAANSLSATFNYGRELNFPWVPLWRDAGEILSGRHLEMVTVLNFGATVLAIVLLVRRWRDLPSPEAFFLGAILLAQLCLGRSWAPYTISYLRYLFATWPFTQLIAMESAALTSNQLRLCTFGFIYLLLCAVTSYLFGIKSFVG